LGAAPGGDLGGQVKGPALVATLAAFARKGQRVHGQAAIVIEVSSPEAGLTQRGHEAGVPILEPDRPRFRHGVLEQLDGLLRASFHEADAEAAKE
jgi:hypothetical protein